jgi:hypothetical protein
MIKRSLSIKNNILDIDQNIIRAVNQKEHSKILKCFQKRYEVGMSLDKISEKLHFLFNWRVFEYRPVEECLEKYYYLSSYYNRIGVDDTDVKNKLDYIKGMIYLLENKNRS